jgi:RsiW-degrading membrane proteinase PrsW (M82 family)
MMSITASFFAAVLPMTLFLSVIWLIDKYEKESLRFVAMHFIWGAVGAIILGISGSFILTFLTGLIGNTSYFGKLIETIIFAPFSEELSKGFFLLYSVNTKQFDNITDGLVYGAAIGLGFGMTENFIYFIALGTNLHSWVYMVVVRSFFSGLMHCIATGTFGAFLGKAKFSNGLVKNILPFAGLVLAMFIHFMWNISVSFAGTYFYGFLFMAVLIVFFILVFRFSLLHEQRIIEHELWEESCNGLLPKSHVKILSSNLRFRKGWITEDIRKLYTRFAVRLAFSKYQFRKCNSNMKSLIAGEIEKNREAVRSLLSNNILAD